VAVDAGQDVVFAAQSGEAAEPVAGRVDLGGERAEGAVLPVAQLQPADAVEGGGGENRFGVGAVLIDHRHADHRDVHAGSIRRPLRLDQPRPDDRTHDVAAGPHRWVTAVEAWRASRRRWPRRRSDRQARSDLVKLCQVLLETSASPERVIHLTREQLLERMDWRSRVEFRSHQIFLVDETLYQLNHLLRWLR
jgi:hypothetical protein